MKLFRVDDHYSELTYNRYSRNPVFLREYPVNYPFVFNSQSGANYKPSYRLVDGEWEPIPERFFNTQLGHRDKWFLEGGWDGSN